MPVIGDLINPADRERLADRLAELRQTERIVTERGQQRPAPLPVPLHKAAASAEETS